MLLQGIHPGYYSGGMVQDAITEALNVTLEAWQAVDEEFPPDDPDLKATALLELDNALQGLEQALRIAGAATQDAS